MNDANDEPGRTAQEAPASRAVPVPRPANGWIALTNQCNLRCAHCAIRYDENRPTERVELSDRAFEEFRSQVLPQLRTLKIGGNNLGEQLAAEKWPQRSAAILESGVKLTMQTNAVLLEEQDIERLVSAGVEFDISVEGADAESYARIRGGHFDTVMGAVGRIAEARSRSRGPRSRIVFSFAIFHDNARQLPALIRLAAGLGVDAVAAMHLIPVWEEQRYQSLVYHRALANEVIAQAREVAEECGVELIAPRPFTVGSMSRRASGGGPAADERAEDAAPRPCPHPWTSVSVNERGEVTPCCNSYMVMGDLNRSSFDEIWNGRRYRRLRDTVNTAKAPANCRTCVLRDYSGTDEPLLLAAIGPNPAFAQSIVVVRRIQRALRNSPVGARILPWAKRVYRKTAS